MTDNAMVKDQNQPKIELIDRHSGLGYLSLDNKVENQITINYNSLSQVRIISE